MKLNLNAKELLALHNLLYERYNVHNRCEHKVDDPRAADDTQLRQVYNRLRACLIAALTNKQIDPVDAFLSREQAKIDRLHDQNAALRKEGHDLAEAAKQDPDFFVPEEGEDYRVPEYPRRGPQNQGGKRGGHKR